MTRNYYTSSNYTDRTTFGGNIYNYDFEGYNSIVDIATRIISDQKFDERCRNNIKQKDKKGNK